MPPLVGVGVKVTFVPVHIVVAEAATATEGVSGLVTVIVTGDDETVAGTAQNSVDVISQVTTSPSLKVVLEYDEPVPALLPLTNHS